MTENTEMSSFVHVAAQLADAMNRLAVAVERLEPDDQRKARLRTEDTTCIIEQRKQTGERRKWARQNGLTDTRAVNVWAFSRLPIEDTNADTLNGAKGCGERTARLIVEWAESLMAAKST